MSFSLKQVVQKSTIDEAKTDKKTKAFSYHMLKNIYEILQSKEECSAVESFLLKADYPIKNIDECISNMLKESEL